MKFHSVQLQPIWSEIVTKSSPTYQQTKSSKVMDFEEEDTAREGLNEHGFNLHEYPEFLYEPNIREIPVYKQDKFTIFNTEFETWWKNIDKAAYKTTPSTTVQGYISEVCRFSEWIMDHMKLSNIKWTLNDLLDFNTKRRHFK